MYVGQKIDKALYINPKLINIGFRLILDCRVPWNFQVVTLIWLGISAEYQKYIGSLILWLLVLNGYSEFQMRDSFYCITPNFANLLRSSTYALTSFFWLLSQVIYLKLTRELQECLPFPSLNFWMINYSFTQKSYLAKLFWSFYHSKVCTFEK